MAITNSPVSRRGSERDASQPTRNRKFARNRPSRTGGEIKVRSFMPALPCSTYGGGSPQRIQQECPSWNHLMHAFRKRKTRVPIGTRQGERGILPEKAAPSILRDLFRDRLDFRVRCGLD